MPMKVPGSEPRNIVVIGMPLSHFSLQTPSHSYVCKVVA